MRATPNLRDGPMPSSRHDGNNGAFSVSLDEDECMMQLHPPRADWINNYPYYLHLWQKPKGEPNVGQIKVSR